MTNQKKKRGPPPKGSRPTPQRTSPAFVTPMAAQVVKRLPEDLPQPKSSRWGGGVTANEMREMQWLKPELVAQIRFVEWTAEGRLRHAAFLGLRSDKSVRGVQQERPA